MLQRFPSHILIINYDQLLIEPTTNLEAISRFLNLSLDGAVISYAIHELRENRSLLAEPALPPWLKKEVNQTKELYGF